MATELDRLLEKSRTTSRFDAPSVPSPSLPGEAPTTSLDKLLDASFERQRETPALTHPGAALDPFAAAAPRGLIQRPEQDPEKELGGPTLESISGAAVGGLKALVDLPQQVALGLAASDDDIARALEKRFDEEMRGTLQRAEELAARPEPVTAVREGEPFFGQPVPEKAPRDPRGFQFQFAETPAGTRAGSFAVSPENQEAVREGLLREEAARFKELQEKKKVVSEAQKTRLIELFPDLKGTAIGKAPVFNLPASALRDTAFLGLSFIAPEIGIAATAGVPAVFEATGADDALKSLGKMSEAWVLRGRSLEEVGPFAEFMAKASPEVIEQLPALIPLALPLMKKAFKTKPGTLDIGTKVFERFDPVATEKALRRRGLEVPPDLVEMSRKAVREEVPTGETPPKRGILRRALNLPPAQAPAGLGKNTLIRRLFGNVPATEASISGLTAAREILRAIGKAGRTEISTLLKSPKAEAAISFVEGLYPDIGKALRKAQQGAIGADLAVKRAIENSPALSKARLLLQKTNPDLIRKGLTPTERLLDPQSAEAVARSKRVIRFGDWVAEAGTMRYLELMLLDTAPQIVRSGKPGFAARKARPGEKGEAISFEARSDRVARILKGLPEVVLEPNQLTPAERTGPRGRGGFLEGDPNQISRRLDIYIRKHAENVAKARGDKPGDPASVDPLADAVAVELKAYQSLFRDMAGAPVEGFYYFPLKGAALNAINKKLAENRTLTEDERINLRARQQFLQGKVGEVPKGQKAVEKQRRAEEAAAELEKVSPKPDLEQKGPTPEILGKTGEPVRRQAQELKEREAQIKRAGEKKAREIAKPTERQKQLIEKTEGKKPETPTEREKAAFKKEKRVPTVIRRLGAPEPPGPKAPTAKPLRTIFLPEGKVAPEGNRPVKIPQDAPAPVKNAELVDSAGNPLTSKPKPEVKKGVHTPANTTLEVLTTAEQAKRTEGTRKVLLDSRGREIGKLTKIERLIKKLEQNKVPTEAEFKFLQRALKQTERALAEDAKKRPAYLAALAEVRRHYRFANTGYMKQIYEPAANAAAQDFAKRLLDPDIRADPFGAVPRMDLRTFTRRVDPEIIRKMGLRAKKGPEPFVITIRSLAPIAAAKNFFKAMEGHPLVRKPGELSVIQEKALLDTGEWVKVPSDEKGYGTLSEALLHVELADDLRRAFSISSGPRSELAKNISDMASFVSMLKAVGSWKANVNNTVGNIVGGNVDLGIPLHEASTLAARASNFLNHPEYGPELRMMGYSPFFDIRFVERLQKDKRFAEVVKTLVPKEDATTAKMLGDGLLGTAELFEAALRMAGVGDTAAFINPSAMADANRMVDLNNRLGAHVWLREKGYSLSDTQRMVEDAFLNYNDPSAIVRALKDFTVGGFGNRFAQNKLGWAARGLHVATNANPQVAMRFWKYPMLIAGWNVAMQKAADLDEEELSIIERSDEVDQRGINGWLRLYLPKDENGNITKIYVGRMNPYGLLSDMSTGTYNALQGTTGVSLISTVLQPHLGISGAFNAARNFDDFYKSEIRPLDAPLHTKVGARTMREYLVNYYTPEQWGRLINHVNEIRATRNDPLLLNMRGLRLEDKELLLQEIFGMPRFRKVDMDRVLQSRARELSSIASNIQQVQTSPRVRRELGIEDENGNKTSEAEELTKFFVGRLTAMNDAMQNTKRRTLTIEAWRAVFEKDPTVKNPKEKAEKFVDNVFKNMKEDWRIINYKDGAFEEE